MNISIRHISDKRFNMALNSSFCLDDQADCGLQFQAGPKRLASTPSASARAVHPAGLRLHGQERAGRVADRLFHVRLWFHPCFIPLHAVHEQQTQWQRPPNTRKHYTQQHLLVEVQVLDFFGAVVIG